MKLLICILFAATATLNFSFANCYKPQRHNFSKLIIDSSINNMSSGKDVPKSSAKICACQVLQVTSNNDPDQFIAVFAEGTNTGNLSSDFSIASSVIQKEKKHLQSFFYNKVKVHENVTSAFSCNMLYNSIKVKYDGLKMYDVLNADVLSKISNNNLARR